MRKALMLMPILATFMVLAMAGTAWAHVEIAPGEVPPGDAREFVVEVPTELDVPTTEVRLVVPGGFEVTEVTPVPGWGGALEDGDVVWSGGEIPVDGAQEFAFVATVPEEAGEFAFAVIQTHADGTEVRWDGPPDSDEPAPVVTVAESGDASGGEDDARHGDDHGSGAVPPTGGMSPGRFLRRPWRLRPRARLGARGVGPGAGQGLAAVKDRQTAALLGVSVVWLLLLCAPAFAHARLVDAYPNDGDALSEPPGQLRLRFDEPVEAEFSPVEVYDEQNRRVDDNARVDPEAPELVVVDLERLTEGSYTVEYRVTSIDGHVIDGEYGFSVGDDARAGERGAEEAPAQGAGRDEPEGAAQGAQGSGHLLHAVGLGVGALVFLALVLLRER